MTVKKPARQRRALDRFTIDQAKAKKDPAYGERKQRELEALQKAVRGG